jgi:squalene-associated FAD-dependent desaturase
LNEKPSVLIAGGGLAGMAAACELADQGARIVLLEKRPFLGGRAYSHQDEAGGLTVDNGQHVFLGCCTEYISFLKRLGVYDRVHLQTRLRVPVIDKIWGESTLASANLPPPLHLLPSLLRFRSLSPGEKVRAAYAFSRIRSLDRLRHPELDGITFAEWLRRNGQNEHSIEAVWNLIVQPTLNDHASRVSADLALMVFQEGFLRTRDGANVGWAKVGLTELLGEAARRYIEERGGEVRTNAAVAGVEVNDGAGVRMLTGETGLAADYYVLGLPSEDVLRVLPSRVAEAPFFARVAKIQTSPIVNVHMWYDRPVWDRGFAAFLNTPLQWAFNKSKLWGQEVSGQYIDISLSGAHDFVDTPGPEIVRLFEKEMQALFPLARGALMERALVTKERGATFAATPGIAALRPPGSTPIRNLFIAGDWTATSWPATMESAVRSGLAAAEGIVKQWRAAGSREPIALVG